MNVCGCECVCMYLIDGDWQIDETEAELESLRGRRKELEEAAVEGSEVMEGLQERIRQLELDLAACIADKAELENNKAEAAEALAAAIAVIS